MCLPGVGVGCVSTTIKPRGDDPLNGCVETAVFVAPVADIWTRTALESGAIVLRVLVNTEGEQHDQRIDPHPPEHLTGPGLEGPVREERQGLLLAHGNDPKGIDGIFGNNTTAATKAFQKAQGMTLQDGVIGQNTWTNLVIN